MEFKTLDIEKMGYAQARIVNELMPLLDSGVHPLVLVFALARCLRVLLRKLPKDEQKQVLPPLFYYITGRTQPPDAEGESALWIPDSVN